MVDLSLLQDFITEALEHLEELESSLLKLEQDPGNRETLDDIFRAIHTIKGASQFTGLPRTSELSHKLENLLDLLRQGERELTQEVTDTLIDTKDRLALLTNELEQSQEEKSDIDDLLARIQALTESRRTDNLPQTEVSDDEAPETDKEDLEKQLEAALDMSVLDETAPTDASVSPSLISSETATSPFAGQVEQNSTIADDLIIGEISGESYDEELFKIFLQQTRKKYAYILDALRELPSSPNKDELLEQAAASLLNMKSASNYMGYVNLTKFLESWLSQIADARREVAAGNKVSLDFMIVYADQLARVIPQIGAPEGASDEDERQEMESVGAVDPAQGQENPFPAESKSADDDLIREEISEEAYDDELFDIFINQLSANLSALRSQLEECKTSESKSELLDRCESNLAAMKSSANYMGYSNLFRFYENWQLAINAAEMQLAKDEEVDLETLLAFVERLVQVIPQANAHLQIDDVSGRQTAIADDEDGEQGVLPETVSESMSTFSTETVSVDEESSLFDTLSASVDAAIGADGSDSFSLHGILEEMLSGNDEPAPATVDTAQQAIEPKPEKTAVPVKAPEVKDAALEKTAGKMESEAEVDQEAQEDAPERRQHERRLKDRRQPEAPGTSVYKHTIRVDSSKIDSLMNQVGELVVSKAYFAQILTDLRSLHQELKEIGMDQRGQKPIRELSFKLAEATVSLSRVSNELQEGVMKVRMLPVSQLFNRYPRLVRDLVHKTDKKVDLVIKGEETELDKMVIEEISDPLIHIIRNAVDHGIESPEERKKAGKPETSTLTLEAYHESNHIVIEVTDDGRGINVELIKDKALEKGLVSEHELERMSDAEAKRFIMMPGFSTAEKPSETSGRGVGMDVIKTNIEKLNGTVEVDSQLGVYTRIRIKIPLTLAIIQALLIRVGPEIYTIPLSVVEETLRIYEHETSVIEGVEVIHLRDTTMPIFKLSELFNVGSKKQDISKSFVVIVTTGMQKIGLVVDELMGQEEVVIKPLVDYLREESGFSGATIIGDGRISLILDIYELVKLTSERQATRYKKFAALSKLKRGQIAEEMSHEHA